MSVDAASGGETGEQRLLPASVVSAGALGLAALYLALVPLHLWVQPARHGVAPALVATAAAAVLARVRWLLRRPDPPVRRLSLVLAVTPVATSLAHVAFTGSLSETPVLMLALVVVGAAVTPGRDAATVLTGAALCWTLLAAVRVDGEVVSAGVQLVMALVLAAVLYGARRRVEGDLRAARDALAGEVSAGHAAAIARTESDKRFQEVFTRSPVGMALANEHGHFVTVNDAFLRLVGRTQREVLGRSGRPFTHPDDLESHDRAQRLVHEADGGGVQVEQRYLRPDGEVRWAWLSMTHTPGPEGQQWTLAHVQDVTERKQAEQVLADSQRNLAAVSRVAHRIQSGEEVRPTIVQAAVELCDASDVYLFEPVGSQSLVLTAASDEDFSCEPIPTDATSAAAEAFRTGRALFLADPGDSPLVSQALLELAGFTSAVWHPVMQADRPVAVLVVAWDHRVASMSDRAASVVALLADETSVALGQEAMRLELQASARTDALTGLPNRREWDDRLQSVFGVARRSGEPVVVAMADLDHFKRLNDYLGHAAGDAHLCAFARAARRCLREVDLLARWGGEEFAIAMPGCPEEVAEQVLARVLDAVPGGETVSLGWSTWDGAETADELLVRVDEALYAAKAAGRARAMPA